MAWTERTVACPECNTERITKAGAGTKLGCASCGVKFPAPPPATDPPTAPAKPRVKRATASSTVVRKNARPRPKNSPTAAGPEGKPATKASEPNPPVQDPAAGAGGDPTDPPAPDPPGDLKPTPPVDRQRAAARRGGLAFYRRFVRRTPEKAA
jgi:hypothetical protein